MAAAAFVGEEVNVDVVFGVALPNFSINQSVFYSHQYFKKCPDTETAICLVCESQLRDEPPAKRRKILKTTDGNTKGMMGDI